MAYWWVSQNKTYKHERDGGYLWAPRTDKAGHTPYHWETMKEVRAGDVIFSYVGQGIVAVSVARSEAAASAERPGEFDKGDIWNQNGLRIDADYSELRTPIPLSEILDSLQPLLPAVHSPLTRGGTGSQGYLFRLPPRAGKFIETCVEQANARIVGDPIVDAIERAPIPQTTKKALVDARIGQGQFRKDLIALWKSRCCVTGMDVVRLLRASHIQPWASSDNSQRLDKFNGLLLSPSYDAAFDEGFLTFDSDGGVTLSPQFSKDAAARVGINSSARIAGLRPEHQTYLDYHRKYRFRDE